MPFGGYYSGKGIKIFVNGQQLESRLGSAIRKGSPCTSKGCLIALMYRLLYDIHLLDEACALAKLVDYEEYIADIYVDTTLQVVVEVDVAAE